LDLEFAVYSIEFLKYVRDFFLRPFGSSKQDNNCVVSSTF